MSIEAGLFQSRTVELRGQHYTVRELTFGEMEIVLEQPRERQNKALLRVAVSNGSGEPLGDDALALPWPVSLELLRLASDLNGVKANPGEGDDAGNG